MAAATSSNDTNVRVGASTLRSTENTKSKIPAGTQTSHKQDTTVTESTPFTPKQDTPARLEVMVGHDLGMCTDISDCMATAHKVQRNWEASLTMVSNLSRVNSKAA